MTQAILIFVQNRAEQALVEHSAVLTGMPVHLTTDLQEFILLCNKNNYSLIIIDSQEVLLSDTQPASSLSPSTTILQITDKTEETNRISLPDQIEYCDQIIRPFTPHDLSCRIKSLLHIQQLCSNFLQTKAQLQVVNKKLNSFQQTIKDQSHYINMLSERDGLTGLFNRQHLKRILDLELPKARHKQTDLSILLLDIDHFREINQTFGHGFGDFILNEFAARLTLTVPEYASCFRFSGEEFVVLLPGNKLAGAAKIAEQLSQCCSDKVFDNGLKKRGVTLSIGVVSLANNHPLSTDDFIYMASRALYKAKAEGRNRIQLSNDIHEQQSPIDSISLLQETLGQLLDKTKQSSISAIKLLAENVASKQKNEHVKKAEQILDFFCEQLNLPTKIEETFHNAFTLYISFRFLLHEQIISKSENFSQEERKIMDILPYKLSELTQLFDYFVNERSLLLCHGEKFNGSGYPEGLAGEEIPLGARIFNLADSFAAMSTDHPYRKRLSPKEILKKLIEGAGQQWDPSLVGSLITIIEKKHLLNIDSSQLEAAKSALKDKGFN